MKKQIIPDETSNDKPSADALLITERERCFAPVGRPGTCGVFAGDNSVSCLQAKEQITVEVVLNYNKSKHNFLRRSTHPLNSSSMEIENLGSISR